MLTDFSKVFDHTDHTITISKLLLMGVDSSLVSWINYFISNREQCVKYADKVSEWTHINAGIPQGTKLGPVVFLAMINDAGWWLQQNCHRYRLLQIC